MACARDSSLLTSLLVGGSDDGCCFPCPLLLEALLGDLFMGLMRSEGRDPFGLVQAVRCMFSIKCASRFKIQR